MIYWLLKKKLYSLSPKVDVNIIFFFPKSINPHIYRIKKTYILNKTNVFNASVLMFTDGQYHVLLFLEQGIILEMFYFQFQKHLTFTASEC